MIQIALLFICYLVGVGFAIRIFLYNKTHDPQFKHDYLAIVNLFKQDGKHLKK